jgi:DNA polymerase-1
VQDKFGVRPDQLGDYLALVGDSSDNIPGMPGVGAKTASKLLTTYGDLQGILRNVEELKGKQQQRFCDAENLQQLELSKKLVSLKSDVDLPDELESFVPRPWDGAALKELCERFEFGSLLNRLAGRGGFSSQAPRKSRIARPSPPPRDVPPPKVEVEPALVISANELATETSAAKQAGSMAIHVEGDGTRHDRERLVGVGLQVPGRKPVYLPVAHRYLGAPRAVPRADLAPLAEVLEDPAVAIVCHDSKVLRKILSREDIGLEGVAMDHMLATYLLDPATDTHDEGAAVRQSLGLEMPARETLVGKGKKAVSWEMVEAGHAATYIGPQLCALLGAREHVDTLLAEQGLQGLYHELEIPIARVLAEMEARGIELDRSVLAEIRDEVSARIAGCESVVFDVAGGPFNLGSTKQLSKLLFEKLGLRSEVMKKTKTGFSTDHEVLEGMVDAHECVAPIIEHRELVKLKGTYVDALPPLVNPKTGRLHTSFRQDVAATGRFSSQDPNLQNIPIRTEVGRSIRRAFVAPPGRLLISADYSQIELRIMAHLSGDPVLTRAFIEGVDVHTQTAAEVFDITLDEVGSTERRVAKAVNYGLIYGQTEFGLGRALGISRAKAGHYISRYFERFSKVANFMEEIVTTARDVGAAYTVCGRKRPIPGLLSKNFRIRSAAERVAQNTPMQGSAADIMKLAMLKVDAILREPTCDASMLLTVHDELIIEVEAGQAESVTKRVQEAMQAAYELKVPLVVDVGLAKSWADAH